MPSVLVAYHISRDDHRAQVAATLQVWGDRIQRSVFVCTLTVEDLADLTNRLRNIIDTRTDAVHIVPVCRTCWEAITTLGQATVEPERLYWAAFEIIPQAANRAEAGLGG
jgi:CRISPR-associated protein Cas2